MILPRKNPFTQPKYTKDVDGPVLGFRRLLCRSGGTDTFRGVLWGSKGLGWVSEIEKGSSRRRGLRRYMITLG